MNTFFLFFGVASFSWYVCKFLFWLEEPVNKKGGKTNAQL